MTVAHQCERISSERKAEPSNLHSGSADSSTPTQPRDSPITGPKQWARNRRDPWDLGWQIWQIGRLVRTSCDKACLRLRSLALARRCETWSDAYLPLNGRLSFLLARPWDDETTPPELSDLALLRNAYLRLWSAAWKHNLRAFLGVF